jgi:hypothetical protein
MQKKQNNLSKIQLLFSIMLFCIFLFGFLFLFKKIKNDDEESQMRELEWQTEAKERNEIRALDNLVKTVESERMQLETHFAQSSDIVPFLDTIEKLASGAVAKMEITSVHILEDHTGLVVGMKASGTFSSLYKFLTLLENSPYELEFVTMDMHSRMVIDTESENKIYPEWDANLKIKLLSFVE